MMGRTLGDVVYGTVKTGAPPRKKRGLTPSGDRGKASLSRFKCKGHKKARPAVDADLEAAWSCAETPTSKKAKIGFLARKGQFNGTKKN